MPQPQVIRWWMGRNWHIEDSNLSRADAYNVRRHVMAKYRNNKVIAHRNGRGYEVLRSPNIGK